MKKIAFLYFLISISLFSASISGNVTVYTGENFGVFVYVKGATGYDITDSNGEFKIEGLKKGQEYKVIFQKENFPDVVKSLKITDEEETVNVVFKKASAVITETKSSKSKSKSKSRVSKKKSNTKNNSGQNNETKNVYSEVKSEKKYNREIKGKVVTSSNETVFIKVKGRNYVTAVAANKDFVFETANEVTTIEIFQNGMKKKEMEVAANESSTSLGEIKLEKEGKPTFEYRVVLNKKIDGIVSLHKDAIEKYAIRVENSDTAVFKNIEPGNYLFKIVSYGNDDYKTLIKIEDGKTEKVDIRNSVANKRIYASLYPDNKEMTVKIYKNEELIKSVEKVKGLFIAENMEDGVDYKITAEAHNYMMQESRAVKAGERVNLVLERDIKGAIVSGTIYPFGAEAEVMILDGENIIGRGKTDENGNYEIETDSIKAGRKIIRVRADGFKEAREIRTINEGKENKNINIALTPLAADIFGKVTVEGAKDSSWVYVIIEELNLWQLTDAEGKYYFNGIPEGKYTIIFRKYGYKELKKEMNFLKQSIKEINTDMIPVGRIVVNSNIDGYKLKINDIETTVEKKVYISEQPVGEYNLTASKDGYLNEKVKISISEAGENKEINITFRNAEEYKKYLEGKLSEISELIDGLYVAQAERKIGEFKSLEDWDNYKTEIDKLARKLNQAKGNLFDDDRRILAEISRVKKEINLLENENISYGEKRRKLSEKYKESLDFIEKILSENKYTTYKYEIYMFKSEIYEKSGMITSAGESKAAALKYKDEQKTKR